MRILLRVVVALSLLLLSNPAPAQRIAPPGGGGGNPNAGDTYQFYVGGDLLRGLDPAWDPVIMAADNGDRLEIRGEGAFTIWPKDADGGGTFVHKDNAGNEIRRGSWIAVEFLSFNSYEGAGLGGQLGLRIELFPEGRTVGIPGKMQVDCPLGNAPPSSVFEARVLFQDSGLNFNRRIQGGTLFFKVHVDPPLCSGLQGTCAHPLCRVGEPLDPTCQPGIDPACVTRICNVDPYCCFQWWHQGCVDAVRTVCGLCCCTKGIAPCD